MKNTVKLGVNLDHVTTLRQVRGTPYPDLLEAIKLSEQAGADGITMHLREDRRHIQDQDVFASREVITTSMNLEMAATSEMERIAIQVRPDYCCLVPERREELTTEGGLDVIAHRERIRDLVASLAERDIMVSLFIEPNALVIDSVLEVGAPIIELHTGRYANTSGVNQQHELQRIEMACQYARANGLVVNAGHGLHCGNVATISGIEGINELNIGHSIIADALFVGLGPAIQKMIAAMRE